jgi:hypothetical protein
MFQLHIFVVYFPFGNATCTTLCKTQHTSIFLPIAPGSVRVNVQKRETMQYSR